MSTRFYAGQTDYIVQLNLMDDEAGGAGGDPVITNDTTSNVAMYPVWVTANSGPLPLKVSSTKLSFNPSTGVLGATGFAGPLTGNVTGNATNVTGTVAATNGGTGQSTWSAGELLYASAANTLAKLAAGAVEQVLLANGAAAPVWTTLGLNHLPGAWVKMSVRVASTANQALSGGTAFPTIDGVLTAAGDRVLLKNQSTASQNGIYVVGGTAGSWTLTRTTDADSSIEIASAVVAVDEGAQAGDNWSTTFKTTDTLGSTNMNWYELLDGNNFGVYALPLTGGTLIGKLNTVVSASGGAGLNLPHGAAPSAPVNGDIWSTTTGVFARVNGNTLDLSSVSGFTGGTLSSKLTTVLSGTGGAGFNLPPGVAPSAPVNGDLWTTSAGLYARINGGTVGPYGTGGGGGSGDVVGPAGATDGNPVFFDTTSGKLVKDAGTVSIAKGGTGQTTAANALDALGGVTQTDIDNSFNACGLGGASADISSTDLNTRYLNGWYEGDNITNAQDTGNWLIDVKQHAFDNLNVTQTIVAVGPTRPVYQPGVTFTRVKSSGTWSAWRSIVGSNPRGASLLLPVTNDQVTLFYTTCAITLLQIHAVIRGSSTPGVNWTIRYAADRNATGTELITGGSNTTTTTTAQNIVSFNNPNIAAGQWVWMRVTSVAGVVDELGISMIWV